MELEAFVSSPGVYGNHKAGPNGGPGHGGAALFTAAATGPTHARKAFGASDGAPLTHLAWRPFASSARKHLRTVHKTFISS